MLEFLEKKLCASGQDAFFSLFPTLHQILDDFVRKQTNQQLALVFTFQTLVQRSDCEDGQTAAMFVQHLCAEYADKFNIDDQAIRCAASEVADPDDDLLTDIKEEPEDSPPMTERHDASPPPGKRKQLDGEAGDTSARKRRKAANQKQSRHEDNADVSLPRPGDTEEVDYGTTKVKVKPPKKSRAKGSAVKNKRKKEASARLLSTDAQITDPQDEADSWSGSRDGTTGVMTPQEKPTPQPTVNEDTCPVCEQRLTKAEIAQHLVSAHHLTRHCVTEDEGGEMWLDEQGKVIYSTSQPQNKKIILMLRKPKQETGNPTASRRKYSKPQGPEFSPIAIKKQPQMDDTIMTKTQPSRVFSCDLCPFKSKYRQSLTRHVKLGHHKEKYKDMTCIKCSAVFSSPAELLSHNKRIHENRVYTCVHCEATFNTRSTLKVHLSYRHAETPKYKCAYCCAVYRYKRELRDHMDLHEGVTRYQCEKCHRKFTFRTSHRRHTKSCKGVVETCSAYTCDTCNTVYKHRQHWRDHMRAKHGQGLHYTCHCGTKFPYRSNLYRHKKYCPVVEDKSPVFRTRDSSLSSINGSVSAPQLSVIPVEKEAPNS